MQGGEGRGRGWGIVYFEVSPLTCTPMLSDMLTLCGLILDLGCGRAILVGSQVTVSHGRVIVCCGRVMRCCCQLVLCIIIQD